MLDSVKKRLFVLSIALVGGLLLIKLAVQLPFNDYPVGNAVLTIAQSRTTFPWNKGINQDIPYHSVINIYGGTTRGQQHYRFWGDNEIDLPGGEVLAQITSQDNGKVETFEVRDAENRIIAMTQEKELRKWAGLFSKREALIGQINVDDRLSPVFAINENDPAWGREETELYGRIVDGDISNVEPLLEVIEYRGGLGLLGERLRVGTRISETDGQVLVETEEDGVLLGDLFFHQGADMKILGQRYRLEEHYPGAFLLGRPRSWFNGYSLELLGESPASNRTLARIVLDARAFTDEVGYEFWLDRNHDGVFEEADKLCTVVYGEQIVQVADREYRTAGKTLIHLWVKSEHYRAEEVRRHLVYVDALLKMMPDAVNHNKVLHSIEYMLDAYQLGINPGLETLANASTEEDGLGITAAHALLTAPFR